MFRGAELVSMSWDDVSVRSDGLVLFVAKSKTDQAGQGQFVYLYHSDDEVLCPMRAVIRLAEFMPEGEPCTGPLFAVLEGADAAISKRTMLVRLHRALQSLGQPSELFGLHSLQP